jgi:hypothetical protein
MPQVRERTGRWIHLRICLGCGYDGAEMQQDGENRVFRCPCCRADLYARPPRSYAQLEGMVADPPGAAVPTRTLVVRAARMWWGWRLLSRLGVVSLRRR